MNVYQKQKKLSTGIYAVRLLEIHKEFVEDRQKFCIKLQVLVDLENFCYEMEEFIIVFDLIRDWKAIKYFINQSCPGLVKSHYEYIHTWPNKPSPVEDVVIGLIIEKWGEYKWLDIGEHRYTHYDEDEKHRRRYGYWISI